jgi:hypothetical protein
MYSIEKCTICIDSFPTLWTFSKGPLPTGASWLLASTEKDSSKERMVSIQASHDMKQASGELGGVNDFSSPFFHVDLFFVELVPQNTYHR